ncbi:MAG: Translation elongation factor P, partial [uncultured Gemmatimonadaceae bacterium]
GNAGDADPPRDGAGVRGRSVPRDRVPAPHAGQPPRDGAGQAQEPAHGLELRAPLPRRRLDRAGGDGDARPGVPVPGRRHVPLHEHRELRPARDGRGDAGRQRPVDAAGDEDPGRVLQRPPHRHPAPAVPGARDRGDVAGDEVGHEDRVVEAGQARERRHGQRARVHRHRREGAGEPHDGRVHGAREV